MIRRGETLVTHDGGEGVKLTSEQVLEAAKELIQLSTDTTFKRQLSNIVERK
ncbi:MAG: hypothetical protein IH946_09385 [Bacteroidetes bacterium]|nr:hypothetical protein [Bacteroidota bacterium]